MTLQERKMVQDLAWDDLKVFLAVARHGTLARAAQALGVNASTLHRRVAALEEALGVALFEKDPRGYVPTAVGEALVPHAETLEEGVLAGLRTVAGHDRAATGPLRITLPQDLVPVLAPHLRALVRACPGITTELLVDERVVDLARETHVALRAGREPPPDALGRRVGTLRWAVYAARGAARDAPWVAYEGMDHVPAVAWWQRAYGNQAVAARVNRVSAMAALLPHVKARGLLPCHAGDADARLRRAGPPLSEGDAPLWVLWHADLRRSARIRAFMDVVVPGLEKALAAGG